jgi:hypothetical protein
MNAAFTPYEEGAGPYEEGAGPYEEGAGPVPGVTGVRGRLCGTTGTAARRARPL